MSPVDGDCCVLPVVRGVIAWPHQFGNAEVLALDPKTVRIVNTVKHHTARICRVDSNSIVTAAKAVWTRQSRWSGSTQHPVNQAGGGRQQNESISVSPTTNSTNSTNWLPYQRLHRCAVQRLPPARAKPAFMYRLASACHSPWCCHWPQAWLQAAREERLQRWVLADRLFGGGRVYFEGLQCMCTDKKT